MPNTLWIEQYAINIKTLKNAPTTQVSLIDATKWMKLLMK